MAIHISITKGSGLGTCRICSKEIKKGEEQIVAEGYHDSGRVHLACLVPVEPESIAEIVAKYYALYRKLKKEKYPDARGEAIKEVADWVYMYEEALVELKKRIKNS